MYTLVSKCIAPRPPPTTLLRTKSAYDVAKVLQAGGIREQPILRSRSASYHGNGYCDTPSFDLGLDEIFKTTVVASDRAAADLTPPKAGSPNHVDRVDTGKAAADNSPSASPDNFHTPIAGLAAAGTSGSEPSTSGPPAA